MVRSRTLRRESIPSPNRPRRTVPFPVPPRPPRDSDKPREACFCRLACDLAWRFKRADTMRAIGRQLDIYQAEIIGIWRCTGCDLGSSFVESRTILSTGRSKRMLMRMFWKMSLVLGIASGGVWSQPFGLQPEAARVVNRALDTVEKNINGGCGTPRMKARSDVLRSPGDPSPFLVRALTHSRIEVAKFAAGTLKFLGKDAALKRWCTSSAPTRRTGKICNAYGTSRYHRWRPGKYRGTLFPSEKMWASKKQKERLRVEFLDCSTGKCATICRAKSPCLQSVTLLQDGSRFKYRNSDSEWTFVFNPGVTYGTLFKNSKHRAFRIRKVK